MTDSVGKGVAAFKKASYVEALGHFNTAIKEKPNNANLYDSRAAAFEKLGQVGRALTDAKKVIDLRPDLAKGYVRSARLFNRARKLDASVKMYDLAIKRAGDTLKQVLEEERRETVVMQRANMNHIAKLPHDLLIIIMLQLDLHDRYNCVQVCRQWAASIQDAPILWSTIELWPALPSPSRMCQIWARRLRGAPAGIRTLVVNGLSGFKHKSHDDISTALLGSGIMSRLRDLRLQDVSGPANPKPSTGEGPRRLVNLVMMSFTQRETLTTLHLDTARGYAFTHSFDYILAQLPNLLDLKVSGAMHRDRMPMRCFEASQEVLEKPERAKLRHLTLRNASFTPGDSLVDMPSLLSLSLFRCPVNQPGSWRFIDWGNLPNLRQLWIQDPSSAGQLSCREMTDLPSLELLVLTRADAVFQDLVGETHDLGIPAPLPALRVPGLRHLRLLGSWDSPGDVWRFLIHNADGWPILEHLEAHGLPIPDLLAPSLDHFFSRIPLLRVLDVASTNFTNLNIESLTRHATRLEFLDVSHCNEITGSPLMRLADARTDKENPQKGCGLVVLKIEGCIRVQDEAVQWLKQRVKHMRFKNWAPEWEGRGGKRLRLA